MRGFLAALAVYALASLVLFGLPILDHPKTTIAAGGEIEPSAYQWFLAWWPDAILEGRNPFVTSFIYAPDRVNMTWVTGIPGPSLALAPVTRTLGPVVSYNVLTLAAPVLAAGAAFLLCRELAGRFWPSLAGGYVFGFSPYMLVALAGIPSHSFTVFIPLAVYLVVRRVKGSLGGRTFVLLLAAVLAGQFLVAVELFALLTVFGGLAGLAAYWLLREQRPVLRAAVPELAGAYLVALAVVSPYLWYMLFEPHMRPVHAIPLEHSSDLLSFAVPTSLQELGSGAFPELERDFGGALPIARGGGAYAYLGLPLLAIVALFAIEQWRRPACKLLLLVAAGLALFSLGPRLFVAGDDLVPLPARLLAELPLLGYALPSRFSVYTALAVAAIIAVWLAHRPAWWKWALAVAGLVFILPNLGSGTWNTPIGTSPFFTEKLYEGVLDEDDVVLTVPVVGSPVRWQAESELPFRLANGYIGRIPEDLERFYAAVASRRPLPERETRAFLARRRVDAILVAEPESEHPFWRRRLAFLGIRPEQRGGVLVYRLRRRG